MSLSRRISRLALTALLFAAFCSAAVSAEASHVANRKFQAEIVEPTARIDTAQPAFDFRSGFWINLHHFLFLQAVLATPDARKGHAETAARESGGAPTLPPEQKIAWEKAVDFYMEFAKRDPLSDRDLVAANYELSDAGNSKSLKGRRLPPAMQSVVEEAAPVYRALWWPEHDRRNHEWAISAGSLVQEYLPRIVRRIAVAYQTDWPKEAITTEVVTYANWAGAYTVTNSTLITISSTDPAGQGYAALETLFHEASHAMVNNFQKQLDDHLHAVGKSATFQLTHAIIFYTAGTLITEALNTKNIHDYVPYAIKNGLYDRVADWKHYRDICEKDWLPYLDGKTSFDAALTNLAADF